MDRLLDQWTSRSKKAGVLLALASVCAGLGFGVRHFRRPPSPSAPSAAAAVAPAPASAPLLFAVRKLPVGDVLVYSFSWSQAVDHSGRSLGQIRGEVKLAGELRIESVGPINGLNALRLSLQNVRLQKVDIAGSSPLAHYDDHESTAPANPMGANETAYVLVDGSGIFRGFHVQPNATSFFLNLIQPLIDFTGVQYADARSGASKQWITTEHAPFGRALTKYVGDTQVEKGVHRSHVRYVDIEGLSSDPSSLEQRLSSSSQIEATAEHVLRVVDDEQLSIIDAAQTRIFVGEHHFRFDLLSQAKGSPTTQASLAGLVPRNLDQPAIGAEIKRNMLQQRIAGLTPELMVERIRNMGVLGELSKQNIFFYRATGLLKLRPELTPPLAGLFFEPGNSVNGQAFIVDLLVGANTVEAQQTIRQILENEPLQQKKSFASLYQRIGMFTAPSRPLAEYAARQYETFRTAPRVMSDPFASDGGADDMPSQDEARWVRRVAATYSLGSMAYHLFHSSNTELAFKYNDWLLRDLRDAKTPEEMEHLLSGLGNTGLVDNLETILGFTRNELPQLRAAAASALYQLDVASARTRLLDLLEDKSTDVQRQAQRSLDACVLSEDEAGRLLRIVREGKAHSTLDDGWIGFFDRKKLRSADAGSALVAVAARHPEDSNLQRRIAGALGAMGPPAKPKK